MGSRDFGQREKKKPKKDSKKQTIISSEIDSQRTEVEVIRKARKPKDIDEE
jgi:hypothetical protein